MFTWFSAFWLLQQLIQYAEDRFSTPGLNGHMYALGIFLSSVAASLCFHQLTVQCTKIGIQCRASLMVLIYRKSLRLSCVPGGIGDIVNLISNDCNRVAEACVNWHYLWSAAFECLSK